MAPQVDPQEGEPHDRELGVPVRPGDELAEHARGNGELLERQLEDVVRDALLEIEDAPAVEEGLRRIAIGEPAGALVREDEPEPDQELPGEIGVAARQKAATCCEGGGHEPRILPARAGAHHPPI